MNNRKIDICYQVVPGILFLLLGVSYYLSPVGDSSLLARLVFLGSFLLLAAGAFLRRDTLSGLILLVLGLLFHACRYGKNSLECLTAGQPVPAVINTLFLAAFLLLALLCLSYYTGKGAEALAGLWFLPALLIGLGFLLLQARALLISGGLHTSFWNFLMPILSWASILLLGVSASDPYFEVDNEESPAPASPSKPVDIPIYTTVSGSAAPAQKPAAPAQKPAAPAQKPTAPARKPAAAPVPSASPARPSLSPAAMEDLKLYKELLDLGVITQAEFEEKKKALADQ